MFGDNNTGNNNSQQVNVNTSIKTLFGETAALQLAYWNDNLSIKLHPVTGVNQDGLRQYDFKRKIGTALTIEKSTALSEAIKKVIYPKIADVTNGEDLDKPVGVAVPIGNKGLLVAIEYKKDAAGVPGTYFTMIYKNPSTGENDGIYTYKFTKTTITFLMDMNTGEKIERTIESEFTYFVNLMESLQTLLSAAHSSDYKAGMRASFGGGYTTKPQTNTGTTGETMASVSKFDDNDLPF